MIRFFERFRFVLIICAVAAASSVSSASQQGRSPQNPPSQQMQGPWWNRAPVVSSRYYRIKSDLPREELRELADHLDRTFEAYIDRLGSLRQNLPTSFDVLIFKDRQDYLTTLSYQYGINAAGSGGMFFRSQGFSALAFWTGNLPKRRIHHVIQHEGFHQVAAALFPNNLPPWVNEGLAEFFGEGIMVGRRLVIGQTNPRIIDAVRDAIETGKYVPFRHMLTMDGRTWNANVQGGSAQLQYHQAWSMVHFLVYAENGRYSVAFSNYLRLLNTGFLPYDAFVRAFGSDDLDAFERRWIEYATHQQPSSFGTALERIEFLAAGLLELAGRDIRPTTFDELREALRAIEFTYTVRHHGLDTTLSAEDESLFSIPRDDLTRGDEVPMFVVEPTRVRPISREEKAWERDNPTPPTVRSESLRPYNVAVQWLRRPGTGELTFELVAR